MNTRTYKLDNIAIISTLGYNQKEKEATNLALVPMIEAGFKFAVLCYDDVFTLQMHNLKEDEQQEVIAEIVHGYNLALKDREL